MRIVLIACLVCATLAAQTAAPGESDIEKGRQLLQQREYFAALKQYQRANQIAGGEVGRRVPRHGARRAGDEDVEEHARLRAVGRGAAGANTRLSHARTGARPGVLGLDDPPNAEEAYRAALAADPDSNIADLHYGLALALLAQHRDDEAIAELKKEIEIRPHGTTAEEAQALIAEPAPRPREIRARFLVQSRGRPDDLARIAARQSRRSRFLPERHGRERCRRR